MVILVLGGSEFVGQAIAMHCIDRGYQVDILTRGQKPVSYTGFREHLILDRNHSEKMNEMLKSRNYDVVIDVSAYTLETIKISTEAINKACLSNYIFISSGAVYEKTETDLTETSLRGPHEDWGTYGLNKLAAENYLFDLYACEEFPITVFRPTYLYGPLNKLYRQSYFYDRIMNQKPIYCPKSDKKIQMLHIDDFVRSIESVFQLDCAKGQAYNITHPQKITWMMLLNAVSMTTGNPVVIEVLDEIMMKQYGITSTRQFFPYRDVHYTMSIDKLIQDGLHVPKIGLKEGLESELTWYNKFRGIINDGGMTHLTVLDERG